ncbi:hypothetical protein [Actinomycetospora sp. TBRC 11914]|uniref:hypothetical protein n=1 Tax=Actinomycetospora sp. TBRC 11914 TaxID=2729387 RepID=UPI00145EEEFF|nr:hypothetical protein [Actinomycetospora sp. TBRC 11914]NMO89971.1 hypothetical protein [Actinomycetospora sp. TBRC 11914]
MTESPQRRVAGHRIGLGAAVLGIATLSGAGTVAAVLPAVPSAHHRPVTADSGAVLGLPAATGTTTLRRDRTDAAVPGAAPFPRTATSPITSIFS